MFYLFPMTSDLGESTVTAWARLVRASQSVIGAIETDLKRGGFPPLDWYDVLLELERAGGELRPREIAKHTLFARYSVTRLVDRMERDGLVVRSACPDDARGQVVQLTDKGRRLRSDMWPAYSAAIQSHFADRLDDAQTEQLSRLLAKLLD